MLYDLAIIGAGAAGLTASIYASRYKIRHLIFGEVMGGQISEAHLVENYPGFPSISGVELIQKFRQHAEGYGVKVRQEGVVGVATLGPATGSSRPTSSSRLSGTAGARRDTLRPCHPSPPFVFKITTKSGKKYQARTLILAMGSRARRLNVPGEEKFLGKGVSYCATCLPPGEEVVANSSLKKIEKIALAQKVLTVNGTFQNINQIMSRDYDGEVVKIKTRFFTEPVGLTANHPVLSTRVTKDHYRGIFTIDKPKWRAAGSLTNQDVLLYPIMTETKDIKKIRFSEILGVEVKKGKAKNNQETYTSRRIDDEIPVDEKFLRLAGYYLAEGGLTRHGVNFYFNKKEKEFIDDVERLIGELFSSEPYLKTEGGVTRVSLFSKLVRDLFQVLFGKCSPNKRIPQWMLLLPPKKQEEIIKGFYRGDGCLRDKDFCLVSTSRTLAYQIRDILLRLGVISSIVKREKGKLNKLPGEIGGRKIRFNHDKYHLTIGGAALEKMSEILKIRHPELDRRTKVCHHAWVENNYLYLPIRTIKRENYQGRVYNLAVGENNTYVARNFIVHNCDAPLFRDKKVAVVGGGDSAVTAALQLADHGNEVFIIVRGKALRAEPVWLERFKERPEIKRILETNVVRVLGEDVVGGVELDKPFGGEKILPVEGVFIEIGTVPAVSLANQLGVELDEEGYIAMGTDGATNVSGVFAAGDLANIPGSPNLRQIVTAAAEGAVAAAGVYKYLRGKAVAPTWGKRR